MKYIMIFLSVCVLNTGFSQDIDRLHHTDKIEILPSMKKGKVYSYDLFRNVFHIFEPDSAGEYVLSVSVKPKYNWYSVDNVLATGSWISASGQPKFYKGTFHYTNTVGAHLVYTFNGCGIRVFSELYPQNGSVAIWLDESLPKSFNLKGQAQTNFNVFEMSVPCGDHVLHMRKDVADGSASVDYFHVKRLTP